MTLALLALVKFGAICVCVGVNMTLPDALPVPALLVADTVQVYGVALIRPVRLIGEVALLNVAVGVQLVLYCVIGAPPLELGAVNGWRPRHRPRSPSRLWVRRAIRH